MSNFLNGLATVWGIPLWAFYVNRGQAITSFGKQNKDAAIAKFVTAEKAYFQTPFTGFRTFLKGKRNGDSWNHMPFFPTSEEKRAKLQRNMMIGLNELEIEEVSSEHQLQTNILYFVAPGQDFPSLVRRTTFTNLDSYNSLELEVLDGLAQLVPNGLGNSAIDNMGRTMEAWMNVYNVGFTQGTDTKITQPFFHISQGTADSAQVQIVRDGFFSLAYVEKTSDKASTKANAIDSENLHDLLPFVVDPSVVFSTDTTLTNPSGFFDFSGSVEELTQSSQGTTSRTPCSFAGVRVTIPPGANVTVTSVYGYAESLETLVGKYSPIVRDVKYSRDKRQLAYDFVADITKRVDTKTSSDVFDAYVKQDFLDNFLRGGLPLLLGGKTTAGNSVTSPSSKVFHVYSRIHGDIERDYNYFQIDTTYFSQGPGNFRDVCQNRRVDVSHSPFVGDFNIRLFLSFIQSDAFNPLTIASTVFKVPNTQLEFVLDSLKILNPDGSLTNNGVGSGGLHREAARTLLSKAFRPGQFFKDAATAGVSFAISKEEVADIIIGFAVQDFAGQFSQNGYWSDHWTYILDLVDNYLTVFPDKEAQLLWDSEPVAFYVSPAVVKPRHSRYVAMDNPAKPGSSVLRVYNAISVWGDSQFPVEKTNAMNAIFQDPNYLVDVNGAGSVWQRSVKDNSVVRVSVIAKLLLLGIVKFSTLDPYGLGVEMEGGKPGWNDAMNGLPGLLGSGMPETYEMLRILRYTHSALLKFSRPVSFPSEFADFLTQLAAAIDRYNSSPKQLADEFVYWDSANTARETYRATVVATFKGEFKSLAASDIVVLLEKFIAKVEGGIQRALAVNSNNGFLSPTYFYYECSQGNYEISTDGVQTSIIAKSFELRTLPLFLEGPTRHLRVVQTVEERRSIYEKVKSSALYDSALKMYTLCESLAAMGQEVGRMKAFSPGWLENQSVWLHMSYKFYLELLRGGLYEEFFSEMATGLVPFMDNKVYGRSPLEAASFIVSSAFPDKKLHGASFLARLSGSTAEFLSMWLLIVSGHQPFSVDPQTKELLLSLQPILPGNFFDEDDEVSFVFLGKVDVVYHNPSREDTWKISAKRATVTKLDGSVVEASDAVIRGDVALLVRNLQAKRVDVYF